MTVIVYAPGGVPPRSGFIGLLPPQAAWKMIPADNAEHRNSPSSLLFLVLRSGFEARPIPNQASPATGNHRAYCRPETPDECGLAEAVCATVETVSVEVTEPSAAGVADFGFKEHAGAKLGDGCTEQANETALLNPPVDVAVTVEVADCPGMTVPGAGAAASREKSGVTKVANTAEGETPVTVTVQSLVPTHASPHPAKLEPEAGVAVREITVPGSTLREQVLPQAMPAGLLVTVPVPLPPRSTVRDGRALNIAVICLSAVMSSVQVPVPVHAPNHPMKGSAGSFALAVRVTVVPLAKLAEQTGVPVEGLQFMPAGLLVTVPPLLASVTMNGPADEPPVRLIDCGLQGASSPILKVAVFAPEVAGVKMVLTIQL